MTPEKISEVWQVEVGGQIYEAPLCELPEWIDEGSLQPGDKVRKGQLRWIEARRVPALAQFFNARSKGELLHLVQQSIDTAVDPALTGIVSDGVMQTEFSETGAFNQFIPADTNEVHPQVRPAGRPNGHCVIHPEMNAAFVCVDCFAEFCISCPRAYGSTVRICPHCGSNCKTYDRVTSDKLRDETSTEFSVEPFGISDLGRALAHPFKFRASLILGGVMFMLFTLGQSASAVGGIFLFAASIFCFMLANMLTFGVLANTIGNFSRGDLGADFMPGFEDFSLWDDVVHPFFLSIGAYLVSFGPFLLVALIGFYMILSAAGEQMKKFNQELSRVPGTQFYEPDRTAEQSQEVRQLLERVKQHNERRVDHQKRLALAADSTHPDREPTTGPTYDLGEEAADLERMLNDSRAKQFDVIGAETSSSPADGVQRSVAAISQVAAPVVVIGALAFIWGLFYFPAACAVAGYSRSIAATVNPMVGLDTVKRLGGTYAKILLMSFVLLLITSVIGAILHLVFSSFDLPRIGNIPAKAVGSLFTFYFSVVFSCVLGYALYKAADRLKLPR